MAGMLESEREIERESRGIFLQSEGKRPFGFLPFSPKPSLPPVLDGSFPPPFYLTLFCTYSYVEMPPGLDVSQPSLFTVLALSVLSTPKCLLLHVCQTFPEFSPEP